LDERPYADAEEGLTEVEKRGGKSKHFEEDLRLISVKKVHLERMD
tara:strand:- start:8 stop:142 length:135 start_codon:yes stop_codon:yes gene_type:complete